MLTSDLIFFSLSEGFKTRFSSQALLTAMLVAEVFQRLKFKYHPKYLKSPMQFSKGIFFLCIMHVNVLQWRAGIATFTSAHIL